jgi:hypothetical protein
LNVPVAKRLVNIMLLKENVVDIAVTTPPQDDDANEVLVSLHWDVTPDVT